MTKTRWAELSGKQQWDIQVALRGPDSSHSEPTKWITTSIIRWAMHTVMRVGGTLNDDLKMVFIPSSPYTLDKMVKESSLPKVLQFSPSHFFNHVVEAAQTLEIPVVGVKDDVYMEAISLLQAPFTILKLWDWARGGIHMEAVEKELRRHLTSHFGWDPDSAVKTHKDYLIAPKQLEPSKEL